MTYRARFISEFPISDRPHTLRVPRRMNSPRRRFGLPLFAMLLLFVVVAAPALARGATNQVSRGQELFQQHRFAEATAALQEERKTQPKGIQPLIYLGRIAFEENRLPDAIRSFEEATFLDPQSSEAFHWLGRAFGIQARELGPPRGFVPARRTKKALEQAVRLDPDNLEARTELATFYHRAPAIVGGSTRAAQTQADEVNRRDPYLGALLAGDFAMDAKKWGEAEHWYEAATERAPAKPEGFFRLGLLYERLQKFERAFQAFEQVLRLDPTEQRALFQLGKTADLSGQRLERGEEALQAYLKCTPFFIMPKLGIAHRHLAGVYVKKGQPQLARTHFLAALELDPEDKDARAGLKKLGPGPKP